MTMDLSNTKSRMEKAVQSLSHDFQGLRTGRAATSMLDSVQADAYGSKMPLNQLGNISAPEARLLTVQVWDQSMVAIVEKAIRESDLGLNPQTEGNLLRIPVPDLSAERRTELAKVAGKYAENARIAVRNIRRDAVDTARGMEKNGEFGEDERHGLETKIQKLTDESINNIDSMLSKKEADIKTV